MAKKGKEKGASGDGKACWEGYYYAGYDSKNKKDICKPNPVKKEKGGFIEPPIERI